MFKIMPKTVLPFATLGAVFFLLFFSCQPPSDAWDNFTKCGSTACVNEALAVKDAFLKDPKMMLAKFRATFNRGDDHVVGWLYILRDSVLFNPAFGPVEARLALQQQIVHAAKPYGNDPKLGEMANSVLSEIESLAITATPQTAPAATAELMLTGTYAFERPNDAGSGELKVLSVDARTIRFSLTVVGRAPAYNQGFMEGQAPVTGNVADINLEEYGGKCHLQITFDGDQAMIKTLAGGPPECGFGNGVMADGFYTRTDDLDPFRAEGGDKAPLALQGRWRSISDPKSEIVLTDGQFQENYAGKEMSKSPYSYHKTCPQDCAPVAADQPCIKVSGQDFICYTVVKADGKTLELSMIGGTGNTLAYKKIE